MGVAVACIWRIQTISQKDTLCRRHNMSHIYQAYATNPKAIYFLFRLWQYLEHKFFKIALEWHGMLCVCCPSQLPFCVALLMPLSKRQKGHCTLPGLENGIFLLTWKHINITSLLFRMWRCHFHLIFIYHFHYSDLPLTFPPSFCRYRSDKSIELRGAI